MRVGARRFGGRFGLAGSSGAYRERGFGPVGLNGAEPKTRIAPKGCGELKYSESILDLVGNTPLVRLHKVAAGVRPAILAKLEALNPGGSVKDRIARTMAADAERTGQLRPGGTIIEPTSGNT